MKQKVSPVIAIIAILVVAGLAAFAWSRAGNVGSSKGDQPPGMPADVAAKFKELGTKVGPSGPTSAAAGGVAHGMTGPGMMGHMTGPNSMAGMTGPGMTGGMTAPNTGR